MRKFGLVDSKRHAETIVDYLLTQGIAASADPPEAAGQPWVLWVREEDELDRARTILDTFSKTPDDPRYQVSDAAEAIRRQQRAEQARRAAQQRSMPHGSMMDIASRRAPFTIGFIIVAVIVSILTQFGRVRARSQVSVGPDGQVQVTVEGDLASTLFRKMMLVDPEVYSRLPPEQQDVLAWIKRGEVWRLVTPMLLHGGMMHLAFNMVAFFSLGGIIERIHGKWFLLAMMLGTGIIASLVQAFVPKELGGNPIALGASGAILGLFGYLWIRPMLEPTYPVRIPPGNVVLILGWVLLCMTPIVTGIANAAHIGGLLAGMAAVPLTIWLGKDS